MAGSAPIHLYCEKQLKENNVTEDHSTTLTWKRQICQDESNPHNCPGPYNPLSTLSSSPLEWAVTAEGLSNSTQVLTDVPAVTWGLELVGAEVSDDAESCRTKGLCGGCWVAAR